MKPKLTPSEKRERNLAAMRVYGKTHREEINLQRKEKRIADGGTTIEQKARNAAYMDVYRQRKDPVAHSERKLKLSRMDQGWCKKGHTPEERGAGRNCKACADIAEALYRSTHRKEGVLRTQRALAKKPAGYAAQKNREYHAKYPEKAKEYRARTKPENLARVQKRNAKKLQAIPKWATDFDDFVFVEAADLARRRFIATGIKWHVDHIVPLQGKTVSGFHVCNNFQVIPAIENIKKGNRTWPNKP